MTCEAVTLKGNPCKLNGRYGVGDTPLCFLHHPWGPERPDVRLTGGRLLRWDKRVGWVVEKGN